MTSTCTKSIGHEINFSPGQLCVPRAIVVSNKVISSICKRTREETTSIYKIYDELLQINCNHHMNLRSYKLQRIIVVHILIATKL